jgi:hypothetical protein
MKIDQLIIHILRSNDDDGGDGFEPETTSESSCRWTSSTCSSALDVSRSWFEIVHSWVGLMGRRLRPFPGMGVRGILSRFLNGIGILLVIGVSTSILASF